MNLIPAEVHRSAAAGLRARTRYWYALILLILTLTGSLVFAAHEIHVMRVESGKALTERSDRLEANLNARFDAIGKRLSERDDQVKGVLTDVGDLVNDTYWDNYASAQTTAVILRDTAEITHQIRETVLPNVNGLIGDTRVLVAGMKTDLDRLTASTDGTLTPLKASLENASSLLKTLDDQVKAGAPEARQTFIKVNKALDDLDKLIADPNVAKTLANVQEGTGSLKEAAESVNVALQPLREKISMLKTILKFVLSRFTYGFGH